MIQVAKMVGISLYQIFKELAHVFGICWVVGQFLQNIFHNPMHAMTKDGYISITATPSERSEHKGVNNVFKDDGDGIPPEAIGRVFKPFIATRSSVCGTGLGFFVKYWISVDHGGAREVSTEPGEGSIFMIWLPTEVI